MTSRYQSADRLEDVFQSEVMEAFANITEFRKFARSQHGLCLSESDIQHITDDTARSEDQKMAMLVKWKQKNGNESTASKIRHLVRQYKKDNFSKAHVTLSGPSFVLYSQKPLGKQSSNVYFGEQETEVTQPRARAIKLVPHSEKNIHVAEILRKLGTHNNLVTVIHCGIYRDGPLKTFVFFVMELCHPKPLSEYLQEWKTFEESFRRTIAKQLIKALGFIHGHAVIHCDISPKNILFSQDMKSIKLTAFDNSVLLTKESIINHGISKNDTVGYHSPETYKKNVFSRKSDIFSAGITLGVVFSNNRHPFGANQTDWVYNITKNKNLDLGHLLVYNKIPMVDLLTQMLHPNASQRPSAAAVQEQLKDHYSTKMPDKVSRKKVEVGNLQLASYRPTEKQLFTATHHNLSANGIIVLDRTDDHLRSYKPSTNEWNQLQKNQMKEFAIVALDDHLYSLEGKSVSRLKYADPTAKWCSVADMIENRGSYPPAVVLEARKSIYVCGGCKCTRSVERYDVEMDQWAFVKYMIFARDLPTLVAVADHIYCIGGLDSGGNELDSVERFDVTSNEWTVQTSSPRPTYCASAIELDGVIFLADDVGIQRFDICNNSWTTTDFGSWWPFKKNRFTKIILLQRTILIIGTKDGNEEAIYLMSPVTNFILPMKNLKSRRLWTPVSLAVKL